MEKYLYTPNTDKNGYKLWMAYPAIEAFALSSLGYMWLYKIADTMDGISAERVYTDTKSTFFRSNEVEAMGFSLSFDFDFMGVFELFERYNIPLYASERDEKFPLIFAGGPVITTNFRPLEMFFDFLIIGDGEVCFKEVLDVLKQRLSKFDTLHLLAKIKGVFVPNVSTTVQKRTEDLEDVIYTPILSDKSYFKDTFIVEVSRGCMNRCAFCTASYINLPFRYYTYEKII